ncbi:hypothetical protein [Salinarimonas ramus]|uniref:Uncharacterized protein n=1 Tax=Salinarimonas ramus TaxID=690164 RepID=A0A917Q4D7_9HYPH|nr:hypothetical protein [Salinarimonas ramus]GGK21468.1 hypothetical protein GCM10011322_05200 [Salinarimonas ramus]
MLDDVKRILVDGPLGVHTAEEFIQACLARAAGPGDTDAVPLFVLARLAQPFCDFYADQALSEATARAFRDRMVATIDACDAAADPAARDAALGNAIREALASA